MLFIKYNVQKIGANFCLIQQFFSHVGMVLPGFKQYLAEDIGDVMYIHVCTVGLLIR